MIKPVTSSQTKQAAKTLFFIVVFAIFCCTIPVGVYTHSILANSISVNGKQLTDNPTTKPGKLPWAEKVVQIDSAEFTAKIIVEDVKKDLDITNPQIIWQLENLTTVRQPEITFTLPGTGNYVLSLFIADGEHPAYSETIMLVFGTEPELPQIQLNSKPLTTINTLTTGENVLEITNPNPDYTYTWDIGSAELQTGTQARITTSSVRLPTKAILRVSNKSNNVYKDREIYLTSNGAEDLQVPQPAIPFAEAPKQNNAAPVILAAAVLIIIVIAGLAFTTYYKKKHK